MLKAIWDHIYRTITKNALRLVSMQSEYLKTIQSLYFSKKREANTFYSETYSAGEKFNGEINSLLKWCK